MFISTLNIQFFFFFYIKINRNIIDLHELLDRNNFNVNLILGEYLVLETKYVNYIYQNVI